MRRMAGSRCQRMPHRAARYPRRARSFPARGEHVRSDTANVDDGRIRAPFPGPATPIGHMSTPGDSGSRVDAGPPGIDVDRATAWLAGHARELVRPLTFTRIGEGQSNLTFLVSDGQGRRLVLRRPPLGELLPSAHDMRREYRIQVGLAGAGAPVPRMLALCEDAAIVGAPFYLMAHVDGVIMTSVH